MLSFLHENKNNEWRASNTTIYNPFGIIDLFEWKKWSRIVPEDFRWSYILTYEIIHGMLHEG